MEKLKVEATPEHILRLSGGTTTSALAELVWNSLDAGALNIQLDVRRNELGGVDQVILQDDGSGIPPSTISETFGKLGRSQKAINSTNKHGDVVHGKLGEGRFRAYALGSRVLWITSQDGRSHLTITGNAESPIEYQIEESSVKTSFGIGTKFEAFNDQQVPISILEDEKLAEELEKIFAPKLLARANLKIKVCGHELNPNQHIAYDVVENLSNGTLRVVVWAKGKHSRLYWCDKSFNVRADEDAEQSYFRIPFSIFISSELVEDAAQSGNLDVRDLTDLGKLKIEAQEIAQKKIAEYRSEKIQLAVSDLKESDVYPYKAEPKDSIEQIEREVFDACAMQIIQHIPAVASATKSEQKLTFSLLKHSLESSPPELQRVLTEVLSLTDEEVKDLADILQRSSMGNLIRLGKTITNRLDFLKLLEHLAYDGDTKKVIKERAHLHKVVEDETWLFGENFSLTTSDSTLNTLLKKILESDNCKVDEDEINGIEDLNDIPDLVMGKQVVIGSGDRLHNLVVEIKRPSVKIGMEEKAQIERYAMKISEVQLFDKAKTDWTFYVVSGEIEPELQNYIDRANDHVQNRIYHGKNVEVFVLSWGQLIQAAKGRMHFLKERLNIDSKTQDAMRYFEKNHALIHQQVQERKEDAAAKLLAKKNSKKSQSKRDGKAINSKKRGK